MMWLLYIYLVVFQDIEAKSMMILMIMIMIIMIKG